MKWSVTKNCPKNMTTFNENEIINEVTHQEMTSRPLKKAKYAYQVKERNERGLHASTYEFCENVSTDVASSDDSEEAIMIDPRSNIKGTTDYSDQYSPSFSSCNDSHTISRNNSAGENVTPVASTSSVYHSLTEETVENAITDQLVDSNNCDCNANKNHAPKQINFALCRWQSKQLAQGIIDNAINKVLGDLGIPSNHNESMNPAFGEPISWGSYLNAQNIENEGVVEAIRQQGLQHKRFVQQSSGCGQHDSTKANIPCESPEGTLRSDLNGPSSSKFFEGAHSGTTELLDDVPTAQCTNSCTKSDLASLLSVQNPTLQKPDLFDDVETLMKPEDLLTTAVSYAISEKGLGVLNVNE